MKRYRKKPVEVNVLTFEDVQTIDKDSLEKSTTFSRKAFNINGHRIYRSVGDANRLSVYVIPTLEGNMQMNYQDVLIIGIEGEIYPCKKNIFEKTYERVYDT